MIAMPSLKASPAGLKKIEVAITRISGERRWAKYGEDWAEEASNLLPRRRTSNGEIQDSVSTSTWHRFLGAQELIKPSNFKAFCDLLGLNWEEIADLPSDSYQDWGDAPDLSATSFYGRHEEISTLEKWILEDRCRLIAILGIGGIGKTKLAVKLGKGGIGKSALSMKVAEKIQGEFEYVIWRSLLSEPSAQYILDDLVKFLSNEQETNLSEIFSEKINKLLSYLRKHRCLIILDNAESVLQGSKRAGQYKDGFEDYGRLFKTLGEAEHQSCVILTSREKPQEIALLEGKTRPVRSLHLGGLDESEGRKIFQDNGDFSGTDKEWEELISFYNGNPLALDIVAKHIRWAFEGSIPRFLELGKNVFGDLQDLLNWHFNRLTESEKEIMYWFAISREPISIELLKEKILSLNSKERVAENLEFLGRRLPIEKTTTGFTLQPVLIEYITGQLIEKVCGEIESVAPNTLNSYALMEAQVKDYIRESQKRVIIEPIVNTISKDKNKNFLIEQLHKIIVYTRNKNQKLGYTGGNVINLLNYMGVDLSDYDFSEIAVWQAYLQGVNLYRVNFRNCDLSKSVFTQSFGNMLSVAFSQKKCLMATGDSNGEVRVYTGNKYQLIYSFNEHNDWVRSVTFCPFGKILASASEDKTIKLWDLESGKLIRTLAEHTDRVWSVAFSSYNKTLASSSGDNTVILWNYETGQRIQILPFDGVPWSVTFNNTGDILAICVKHSVKLWDLKENRLLNSLDGHEDTTRSAIFLNDETIASTGTDGCIRIWDIRDSERRSILNENENKTRIWSLALNPHDSEILATGGDDGIVKLWNTRTRQLIKTLVGHDNWIRSVAFNPNDDTLVSVGEDQTLKIWDSKTGQCLKTLKGNIDWIRSTAFNPKDGKIIAIGSADKTIRLWDTSTGELLKTLIGHKNWVRAVAFNPEDGLFLASGSADATIKIWRATNQEQASLGDYQEFKTLIGHTDRIWSLSFSPKVLDNTPKLASGGEDKTIRVWNINTEECRIFNGHSKRVLTVSFSPDGNYLLSASEDQTAKLWEVSTGRCLKTFSCDVKWLWAVNFSYDLENLASPCDDFSIKIWDINTDELVRTLVGHIGRVYPVSFSSNRRLLASGGEDKTVRIWDIKTGECLHIFEGHDSWIRSVSFSPNNDIVASGTEHRTVNLWNLKNTEHSLTLTAPRPYEGCNISGVTFGEQVDKNIERIEKNKLKQLGAIESFGVA
jgi:WD40 repeat protein